MRIHLFYFRPSGHSLVNVGFEKRSLNKIRALMFSIFFPCRLSLSLSFPFTILHCYTKRYEHNDNPFTTTIPHSSAVATILLTTTKCPSKHPDACTKINQGSATGHDEGPQEPRLSSFRLLCQSIRPGTQCRH